MWRSQNPRFVQDTWMQDSDLNHFTIFLYLSALEDVD